MSLPPDIHFQVGDFKYKRSTRVQFAWKSLETQAEGAGIRAADLDSIGALLEAANISRGEEELLPPEITHWLAKSVTDTIDMLCAGAQRLKTRSSAIILSDMLRRFENDVSGKFSPDTVYWLTDTKRQLDVIAPALHQLEKDREANDEHRTSSANRLYELSLKVRLAELKDWDSLEIKQTMAKAQCKLSCHVACLDAVAAALETYSGDDASAAAKDAWEAFNMEQTMATQLRTVMEQVCKADEEANSEAARVSEELDELCSIYSKLLHAQGEKRKCQWCSSVQARTGAGSGCNKHSLDPRRFPKLSYLEHAAGLKVFCKTFRLRSVTLDRDTDKVDEGKEESRRRVQFSDTITYYQDEDEASGDEEHDQPISQDSDTEPRWNK